MPILLDIDRSNNLIVDTNTSLKFEPSKKLIFVLSAVRPDR